MRISLCLPSQGARVNWGAKLTGLRVVRVQDLAHLGGKGRKRKRFLQKGVTPVEAFRLDERVVRVAGHVQNLDTRPKAADLLCDSATGCSRHDHIREKQIDIANGFATDWQIAAEKFAALKDDKGLFPPYFLAPVVRMDTVASNPKAVEALERVGAVIDNATMQELNRQVEVDKKEPRQVAAAFLKAKGVIR